MMDYRTYGLPFAYLLTYLETMLQQRGERLYTVLKQVTIHGICVDLALVLIPISQKVKINSSDASHSDVW